MPTPTGAPVPAGIRGRPDAPPFRPCGEWCMTGKHLLSSKRTPANSRVHTPCSGHAQNLGTTIRSRGSDETPPPRTRGPGHGPGRLHGAALASSPGDTAQPGTKSCARADADGRHRCTGPLEPALSARMIQHPTSLSCPLTWRVLSHLLGRRASFTVPSSTVPTIDNPGADGVDMVQRGCATCDPTPRFRPTRRMNHVPVTHGQITDKLEHGQGMEPEYDRAGLQ